MRKKIHKFEQQKCMRIHKNLKEERIVINE